MLPSYTPQYGVCTGKFIFRPAVGAVQLVDRLNHVWPLEMVSLAQGGFGGSNNEGVEKLPRVWRYDAEDKLVQAGDMVTILLAYNDPGRPIVTGAIRALRPGDFFTTDHNAAGADENRLKARVASQDGQGGETGWVELKVGDEEEGGGGTVDLVASQKIAMSAQGAFLFLGGWAELAEHTDGARLVISGGETVLSAGGATEPPIKGDTFLAALKTFLQTFATGTHVAGAAALLTALEAPGAGFLASVVKVE